jgi:hypothetical protein
MFAKATLWKVAQSHTLTIQGYYPSDKTIKYPTHLFRTNFSNFNNFVNPWQGLLKLCAEY